LNERVFGELADWLAQGPVVLASVLATRGATPRKAGARMLVAADRTAHSIGGGLAEARVIAAARALLAAPQAASEVRIDLSGGADAAGVCGGQMRLALRRWAGADDRARAQAIARALAAGNPVDLTAADVGAADGAGEIAPQPRLVIVGGGHCGSALYQLARLLDYDIWIFDPRAEYAHADAFPGATVLSGEFAQLRAALATRRALDVVLLNRDYPSDVETLRVLAGGAFAFLGMMGSRRRIAQVLAALPPEQAAQLAALRAPVGLEIGAQTPHEIAVSVLAHLIQVRARPGEA